MGREIRLRVITILAVVCFISTAHAIEGNAVYYNPPYVPSACYGWQNRGNMVAGVSDAFWGNRAACGRRYRVTCIGPAYGDHNPCKRDNSVVVTVVDYCRPPCNGVINLSLDAFSAIANPPAGKVRVRFDQI